MNISVIIPMYNDEKYIQESIQSALMQSSVLEVIVIDDNSTDGSVNLVREMMDKNQSIILIEGQKNQGSAAARNTGKKSASGKYISFLDADDFYLKDRFDAPLKILEGNNALDGTYGKMENYDNDSFHFTGEIFEISDPVESEALFSYIAKDNKPYFHHSSMVLRKESIDDIWYDEGLKIGQDIDFIHQIALHCTLVNDGQDVKIARRIHSNNISLSTLHDAYDPRFRISEKWFYKIKDHNLGGKNARLLSYRYLNQVYHKKYKDWILLRYPLKLFISFNLMMKHPWLFKKLF